MLSSKLYPTCPQTSCVESDCRASCLRGWHNQHTARFLVSQRAALAVSSNGRTQLRRCSPALRQAVVLRQHQDEGGWSDCAPAANGYKWDRATLTTQPPPVGSCLLDESLYTTTHSTRQPHVHLASEAAASTAAADAAAAATGRQQLLLPQAREAANQPDPITFSLLFGVCKKSVTQSLLKPCTHDASHTQV